MSSPALCGNIRRVRKTCSGSGCVARVFTELSSGDKSLLIVSSSIFTAMRRSWRSNSMANSMNGLPNTTPSGQRVLNGSASASFDSQTPKFATISIPSWRGYAPSCGRRLREKEVGLVEGDDETMGRQQPIHRRADDEEHADIEKRAQGEIGEERQPTEERAGIAAQHKSFEREESRADRCAHYGADHGRPVLGGGGE